MTLTAHAITGAALASLTPSQPLLGFAVGFVSHFVLDAIPHWDYKFASMKRDENNRLNDDMVINKDFAKDLLKISLDCLIGFLVTYFIFVFYLKYSIFVILCGVAGAALPDLLQFVQMKWKHEPLNSLRRFHVWIQSWISLDDKPVFGILSQVATNAFVMDAMNIFHCG